MRPFGYEYAWRREWNAWQRIFIRIFGIVDLPTRIRARAVLWAMRRVHSNRVLDVGCGTGVYTLCLTRVSACQVVAIDIDANRVESIRRIGSELQRHGLSAMCGDETALASLPKTAFSTVLAVEVLQYFHDLPRTLRELQERLRPGGCLIAHVPVRTALLPHENTLFNDAELARLIIEAGFEPAELRQTFGSAALALCEIFAWLVPRPALLAVVYPLLLIAMHLTPRFTDKGDFRLVVARKPVVPVTLGAFTGTPGVSF